MQWKLRHKAALVILGLLGTFGAPGGGTSIAAFAGVAVGSFFVAFLIVAVIGNLAQGIGGGSSGEGPNAAD